jgi:hypothetical protein
MRRIIWQHLWETLEKTNLISSDIEQTSGCLGLAEGKMDQEGSQRNFLG